MKNEVTRDEIFAMVQQFRKGEGKGKGKGMKSACWSCGLNDHYTQQAETARMISRTLKNQKGVKAGSDADKGWEHR